MGGAVFLYNIIAVIYGRALFQPMGESVHMCAKFYA
jgi:hypothetical protein